MLQNDVLGISCFSARVSLFVVENRATAENVADDNEEEEEKRSDNKLSINYILMVLMYAFGLIAIG